MAYKDMFTVLVVDSRIKRSRSLNDAFERILGYLRDVHHLRTDLIGTTEDAIIRLRNDASVGWFHEISPALFRALRHGPG
jgi:hypothetical protein